MGKSKTQHKSWGGAWTEDKLDCFENYVKASLTIMNVYRDKFHWDLLYFDGFAGSGDTGQTMEEDKKVITLFGEETLNTEELHVYQGAAERVVQIEQKMRGFDYYYFIDIDDASLTRLDIKLSKHTVNGRMILRAGDANAEVLKMVDFLKKHPKTKVLCLLDPFGMSIKWDTINALAGNGIDLWILVPTGSIVNRLIQNNGELRFPEKLEEFFGLSREIIKGRFYEKRTIPADLFDTDREEVRKVKNIIGEISQLYCEQLGGLFKYVTNKPLVMTNSKGLPIFHFVCASENQTAVKIAQDIINRKQGK